MGSSKRSGDGRRRLLDPAVRASQSIWALLAPGVEELIVGRLAEALASGAWDAEHGHLRTAGDVRWRPAAGHLRRFLRMDDGLSDRHRVPAELLAREPIVRKPRFVRWARRYLL
jgi:hypothetical protein